MPARGAHDIDARAVQRELNKTPEQRRLEAVLLEAYGSIPTRRKWPKRAPAHPCDRCGISTRNRGLCHDCRDVTG